MKATILRIMAALVAVVMIICCFSSCAIGGGDEETTVTKPDSVDGPNQEDIDDEEFADAPIDGELDDEEETTAEETDTPDEEETTKKERPTKPADIDFDVPENPSAGNGTTNDGLTYDQRVAILKALGYEYDAEQKVFYSVLNPWQRHFGFGDEYDWAAGYANMKYTTIKVDFNYKGLLWRIQCWKGQYGVLAGGEMGVYTKDPNSDSTFYECASDENLLEMSFKYYKTIKDFNNKKPTFERKLQEHWWLTGFQFGYCTSTNCVMEMTLNAKDKEMADGIEQGLKNVTDYWGNPNGFKQYKSGAKGSDFYIRNGNTFKIIWVKAGYQNYGPNGEPGRPTSPDNPELTTAPAV